MSDSARPGAAVQRAARIEDSPLHGRTRLQGRIVTDPDEIADIGACIAYGKLPFWQRWITPAPKGWKR